ncbi:MAG: UDP-N-acetylglucosamine 2-epimerase (non-hydrolyzing) [Bacillota bacterium]|nr:UDP-N-acetylglucosamine 2-epimerase (non-hydrolyzing) [Bacillota bacterium]
MPPVRVMAVFGTRPEAIKMAPVVLELRKDPCFTVEVAVTAQHREMLDQVLDHFGIVPDYDLDIMLPGQTLTQTTVRGLTRLERVLRRVRPQLVLVHGDTVTTMVGALAAFYQQIPVGHVEAGLRTRHKYAPFPEEMCRHLTGVLADLHFAPTARARRNLLEEGVPAAGIYVTGNTVIDALFWTVRADYRFRHPRLGELDFAGRRVIAVDVHRRENFGTPMRSIFGGLRRLAEERPDILLVVSVHRNPQVVSVAEEFLRGVPRTELLDPLDYPDWANLMSRCYLVISDSGGLQEEAPALGKPVLVLREVTERPEALEAGTVRLVGTDGDALYREACRLLDDADAYRQMARAKNPYGDGRAAWRIRAALRHNFLGEDPPEDYA